MKDDVISRKATIDAIAKYLGRLQPPNTWETWRSTGKVILDIVPPAEPERIKGHWIEITSSNHTYKCSVCGRLLVNITDGKNNVAKNYPYCHCGADMGEGEQDDKCRQV